MKSTRETDYAVMTMAFLAREGAGRVVVRRNIAGALGLPETFLAKVLGKLARAGLVQSFHGARGGYRLARPASGITLADVIGAIDGPVRLLCSLDVREEDCRRFCLCEAGEAARRLQGRIQAALSDVSLAALAGSSRPPSGGPRVPRRRRQANRSETAP